MADAWLAAWGGGDDEVLSVSAAPRVLRLAQIAPNCQMTGQSPVYTRVARGGRTEVGFEVECAA